MNEPNNTHVEQVGGSHYQAEVQHWDICERYDVGYLEATATKYLTRWRKRNTAVLDLGKAASYFEKLLVCRPGQGARRLVPEDALRAFYDANRIHWMDAEIITMVLASGSRADIEEALRRTRDLLESAN